MKVTLTCSKPSIGEIIIEMESREYVGAAIVDMYYRINGGDRGSISRLDSENAAIRFWTPIKINGKKINGIAMPNYAEIKSVRDELLAGCQSEIEAAKASRTDTLKSGAQPLEMYYSDGEYLSGYRASGESATLLIALGVAREVSGWGCLVDSKMIKALGSEITYPMAAEYARPALTAKAEAAKAKAEKRQAVFDMARESGQKQLLRSWSEDCNDPREDCSMDMVYEYAMPDGTTTRQRSHTW